LLATGERTRKRTVETRDDLAAHEPEVARLARDELSNPEIRARLLNQPAYHRVSPAQGLQQAGRQLAQRARAGASAGTEHRRRGLSVKLRPRPASCWTPITSKQW
jgi:hypothetical protein